MALHASVVERQTPQTQNLLPQGVRVRISPLAPVDNSGMASQKVASLMKVKLLHTAIPLCNIAGGSRYYYVGFKWFKKL